MKFIVTDEENSVLKKLWSHKEMICGTEKGEAIKQTKEKEFGVIINEAGSTSFQSSILAGQWFSMKADMFIFAILNKLKAYWKSGEMKKGKGRRRIPWSKKYNDLHIPLWVLYWQLKTLPGHTLKPYIRF